MTNDLVDIGHGDGQSDQDVGAIPRLGEFEPRAADHDLFAEVDKGGQHLAKAHLLGPAAIQRQGVDRKGALQLGEPIELVQHHLAAGVALELDHHAHARAVAFVAQVADALDALLAHQFGDAGDHGRLVHLDTGWR